MNATIHLTSKYVGTAKKAGTIKVELSEVPSSGDSFFSLHIKTEEPDGSKDDIGIFFDSLSEVSRFRAALDDAVTKAIFG